MAKEREGKGQNDTNAQIITTDSGRIYQPKNLLSAISEIQQFYVIESKGQNIPAEFLTLERTLDFFKIGIKSGFHEGFALILLFPLFHFYLFPFVFHQLDLFSQILFGCIPYLPLIINTGMCSYISRYYVGNITRKGINSLLMGRALVLTGQGLPGLRCLPDSFPDQHPAKYLEICAPIRVQGPGNILWIPYD